MIVGYIFIFSDGSSKTHDHRTDDWTELVAIRMMRNIVARFTVRLK